MSGGEGLGCTFCTLLCAQSEDEFTFLLRIGTDQGVIERLKQHTPPKIGGHSNQQTQAESGGNPMSTTPTIHARPFGEYETNCYVLDNGDTQLIIDPGRGAAPWVESLLTHPLAILNTHGHFDHVWDNAILKQRHSLPLYIHRKDAFLLTHDPFGLGTPPSEPDVLVDGEEPLTLGEWEVVFHHFPGHTPGCCIVQVGQEFFSGDFIFKRSIGRSDFPYSDQKAMRESLQRFGKWDKQGVLYPGHGESTTITEEQRHLPLMLGMV